MASKANSKRVAIIGGSGKMGQWFSHFFASLGFDVEILDPVNSNSVFPHLGSLDEVIDHDIVVVASSLHASNGILVELSKLKPRGLIFDIASLKGPLKEGLLAVAQADLNVTSMHPMFGPNTQLLSGRHVIVVDLGNKSANEEAAKLFAPTMAEIIHMDADEHDRTMAFLLGLSHAVNIAFSSVLCKSGKSAPRLKELSSTTFDAQISIAARVALENPKLYFEIQAANPYGDVALQMLEKATKDLREIVKAKDEDQFISLMQESKLYYQAIEKENEL